MWIPTSRSAVRLPRGATVIELLAVLAILGVLAAIAILRPGLGESRGRAEGVRLLSEAREIREAQEAYRSEAGHYYTGPLDSAATGAVGFGYSPPPDIWLEVETAEPDHWTARVAIRPRSGPPRRYCRLSIGNEGDQGGCTAGVGWGLDQPGSGIGGQLPKPDGQQ